MSGGLHWIDFLIIAVYVAGMLALGWYYSRRQTSSDEYFTGGGKMNPILIGISLFATLLSTISYLAKPGEIIKNGPYILTSVFSIPIAFLVVGYVLIPVFMRYRVTSAYELLEQKLGLSSRLLGAGMLVTLRVMWMSVLYMATSDASDARKSYLVNSIASIVVSLVLALVGLALMVYFRTYPNQLPQGETVLGSADQLFPWFISHHLPIGLSGLVVSGMFAAAMSSVDSGVNSITAVVKSDFIDRFRPPRESSDSTNKASDRRDVRIARLIAIAVGMIVIFGSTLIEYVPGNLLAVSKRATDLLVTPLFTLFFMALFVRFATPTGANMGSICGFVAASLIAFWNPLFEQQRSLSFTWINPVALLVGVSVGCMVSLLTSRHENQSKVLS